MEQYTYFIPLVTSLIFIILITGVKSFKTRPLKILLWYFIISLLMIVFGVSNRYEELASFNIYSHPIFGGIHLCIIPLYLLYLKAITNGSFYVKRVHIWHFLPAVIYFVTLSFAVFLLPSKEVNLFIRSYDYDVISNNFLRNLNFYASKSLFFLYDIQCLVYFSLMIIELSGYQKKIKNELSFKNNRVSLKWFRGYIFILLVFEIYSLVAEGIFHVDRYLRYDLIQFTTIAYIGFFGLRQAEFGLFSEDGKAGEEKDHMESKVPGISASFIEELYKRLVKTIETEELYLDKKLTLSALANKLNTNRSYLSAAINEHYKDNFYNLINQYRITRATELLKNPENDIYTLESIGKQAGFNYNSTFVAAFKKNIGVTPSAYRKNIKKQ